MSEMTTKTANAVGKKKKMTTRELTTLGLLTGILLVMSFTPLGYFRTLGIDISLMMIPVGIGAMLMGRIVWGIACIVIYGAMGNAFTWSIFLAGAFVNAIPGIIVHIILIPALVIALRTSNMIDIEQ